LHGTVRRRSDRHKREGAYAFVSVEQLVEDFIAAVEAAREK